MSHTVRCLVLTFLLLAGSLGAAAQSANDTGATGRRVDFRLTPFDDTLFTAIDGAFRTRLDPDGHIWYTTEGGLVRVDPDNETREIYTKFEGLPSSYTLGLAISGDKVYVGTDLGVGVVDRRSGNVTRIDPLNSPLPDQITQEVTLVGDDLWIGTRFYGVAIWNTTKPLGAATSWTLKNTSTTPEYAQPVRRVQATPTAVWVGTEGDGVWRYDRASRTWNVTVKEDGLPDNNVLSVTERNGSVWFGTAKGLAARNATGMYTIYNRTNSGIPDDRILDLDVIPTLDGTFDIFASTRKGLWQLAPESGKNATRAQSFGILGSYIFDNEFTSRGWLIATNRGISYQRAGEWSYYATGPSSGPSWGPLSFGYTSASVGDSGSFLWFGSARGLAAYRVPADGNTGYWQNFGEWQNYPGSVVNWIDTEGNTTWFGTNAGTWGFEHESGRWISKLASNSRNLVYGVEADRGELWVALFGDGLIMENLTTGITRSWDANSLVNTLPDLYLTDVRAGGEDMWLGSSTGVIRLDRATGSVRATYSKADGVPGTGIVFRVLPEGPNVWVGTKDGGVARLDIASGKVSRVWNATTAPGFPDGEIRSLHREGGRLWVGTTEGLARIDIATGATRSWNQSNSGLVQNFVNGITSADGLLYLATLSGVQRLDIQKNEFLPLHDGPGVIRSQGAGAAGGLARPTVRIDSPRDGSAVTGLTQIRGTAFVFGGKIDSVEVRIDEGAWQTANGTETWSFDWDPSAHPANEAVVIGARATTGNATASIEIAVTPVAAPKIPLTLEEVPPGDAFADRPFQVAARAEGDEPLTAAYYYSPPGASTFTRIELARQGALFLGSVPARDMREGELRYYFEAQSGLLVTTAAGDASNPSRLDVDPAPTLAVSVTAPPLVEARAGTDAQFTLQVTNSGTQPATFRLAASGLRSAWVTLPLVDLKLEPGATEDVTATLTVPTAAFADETSITFEARDASGAADPAFATVPIRVLAAETPTPATPPTAATPRGFIPMPPLVGILALVAAAAVLFRRSDP